jgi:hypothetical protein
VLRRFLSHRWDRKPATFKLFANHDFAKTMPADDSEGQATATRRTGPDRALARDAGKPHLRRRNRRAGSFGLGAIRNVGSSRVQLVEFELK